MRRWDRRKALAEIARRIERQMPEMRLSGEADIAAVGSLRLKLRPAPRPNCRTVAKAFVTALRRRKWNRVIVVKLPPHLRDCAWVVRRPRIAVYMIEQYDLYADKETIGVEMIGGLARG